MWGKNKAQNGYDKTELVCVHMAHMSIHVSTVHITGPDMRLSPEIGLNVFCASSLPFLSVRTAIEPSDSHSMSSYPISVQRTHLTHSELFLLTMIVSLGHEGQVACAKPLDNAEMNCGVALLVGGEMKQVFRASFHTCRKYRMSQGAMLAFTLVPILYLEPQLCGVATMGDNEVPVALANMSRTQWILGSLWPGPRHMAIHSRILSHHTAPCCHLFLSRDEYIMSRWI